jgi:hypothetical protein
LNHSPQLGNRTAADLTVLLGGAPKSGDHQAMRKYMHRLAEAGLAVMLVYPGSKLPADLREPTRKRAADRAAQKAAREAGRRDWHKVRSPAGLALATTDADALDGYLDRYVELFGDAVAVNLAVEVGCSGLVVVDCDTRDQLAAFLADAGADLGTQPTVRSPGQRGPGGEWVHSDGGHFWFVLPEGVDLPTGTGAMTIGAADDDSSRYSVLWDRRYVLIPPSVRAEGPYTVTGEVHELPESLAERIAEHSRLRAERATRAGSRLAGSRVEAWGASVTWAGILAGSEWVASGRVDSCGCEIWTAPGLHASPKSATAHEPGCGQWIDSPDPPLHIWTDHDIEPFGRRVAENGRRTVSRLEAVSAIYHDDQLGATMTALDLGDSDALALDDDLPADFGRAGRSDDHVAEEGGGVCLPEEFWNAHPVLEHIRAFAHYGVNSADAVLGAALARLSAHLDPCVRISTGVKRPLPLNTFTGIVGSAGTGKSSAYHASADLLAFKNPDPMSSGLEASAAEVPPELPVGSGPGVAEAFMGLVVPDPLNPKIKARVQVRHKVLFNSDEGAGLVSGILDAKRGQDIGPTLRAAWTGAVLGQANASAERTREVRNYSLGLCVGFQLEALAAMSTEEQLEYGTPQRFVYVSATDPSIPDEAPPFPGPLEVVLPDGPLRYDAELRTRARQEALARARGEAEGTAEGDPMRAHRPALVARCAALLVVLCEPGRNEVHSGDVELAEMLLDTSARLHGMAMEWRREREAAERERQLQGRIREQVATAVALDGRQDDMTRLSERLLAYVDDAGGSVEWTGRAGLRRAKFNAGDRPIADAALARLAGEGGPLERDGNTITRRVS